jgi:hypothetical protein
LPGYIHKFYEAVAIPTESLAQVVAFAMSQPGEVNLSAILFRPTPEELYLQLGIVYRELQSAFAQALDPVIRKRAKSFYCPHHRQLAFTR